MMKRLFDYDGTLMSIMSKVMYLVATNVLFLISSIPVITIGAAATAMHEALLGFAQDEEPDIVRTYFQSFIRHLKKATVIWTAILAAVLTLVMNFYYLYRHTILFEDLVRGILNLVVLICAVLWIFTFPLIAYREDRNVNDCLLSLKMAVFRLPYTLVLLLINSIPILFVLFMAQFSSFAALFFLVCGFSIPAYFSDFILLKVFLPYGEQKANEFEKEI